MNAGMNERDKEKKLLLNLPGMTLLLDWRYSRFLVFYRIFCLLLESASLVISVPKAVLVSVYRAVRPSKPKDMTGILVLITGSGNGIGLELAVKFGELGAKLICVDVDEGGNRHTEERLKKIGCVHYMYHCDVSDKEDVDRVSADIIKKVGVPGILINNAAVTERKPFLKHFQNELEILFLTNVVGPMYLLQRFLPHMLDHPNHKFQIVGISSIVGILGTPHMIPYSASKFAVTGFMEGLHYELRADKVENIVVTSIYPFLISNNSKTKPALRYQGLVGILKVEDAVNQIMLGISREEREVFVPHSLYYLTRLLRILPEAAQTKILEFLEFGSVP